MALARRHSASALSGGGAWSREARVVVALVALAGIAFYAARDDHMRSCLMRQDSESLWIPIAPGGAPCRFGKDADNQRGHVAPRRSALARGTVEAQVSRPLVERSA
jgi:hypothetical protein